MAKGRHGDAEIRAALYNKKFRHFEPRSDVLVVDELGLAHAKSRVDVAVINGTIHGYEIKSDRDTLVRFDAQLETYRQTLGRLTVVCAPRHLCHVLNDAPDWCGIIEANSGTRGAVHFTTHRSARLNPEVKPVMLAHLLWKAEAEAALSAKGLGANELRKPRIALYEMIAELMTPKEITALIRSAMIKRTRWRDRPIQPSCDG
ncbi:MAG: sce7726 family protein [Hyphomonas sp.]|nr:sce7726 family protein [Hyphomonas sp.]